MVLSISNTIPPLVLKDGTYKRGAARCLGGVQWE